ncbi:MAG: hypothetical protein M3327_09080 [Actinomycetota bacterium]|nr:hypothetical protein [Actinomycetota bacterium]
MAERLRDGKAEPLLEFNRGDERSSQSARKGATGRIEHRDSLVQETHVVAPDEGPSIHQARMEVADARRVFAYEPKEHVASRPPDRPDDRIGALRSTALEDFG